MRNIAFRHWSEEQDNNEKKKNEAKMYVSIEASNKALKHQARD